jgi:hydrogenase maturation protease
MNEFHRNDSSCPVTIAGAGHALLAIDAIGPQVLSRITHRYGNDVELCETGTNGLALLDILRRQELLIIVDACIGTGPPGSVSIIDPTLEETAIHGTSVHQIGPIEALQVGRLLYPERMPRRSLLIAVDTDGLKDDGEEAACERAIQALDQEIEAWRAAKTQPGKENNHAKQ